MHHDEQTSPAPQSRDDDNFGKRIKASRVAAGLSQRELAAELKANGLSIDASAITRMETGERSVKINEAQAIARALRTTVGILLNEQDRPPLSHIRARANYHMHDARRLLTGMLQDMATVQAGLREDPRQMSIFADLPEPPESPEDYLPWVLGRMKEIAYKWPTAAASSPEDAELLRKIAVSFVGRIIEVDAEWFNQPEFDDEAEWVGTENG